MYPQAMSLIQPMPEGKLDIVGDIHGEIDALKALLSHLGYNLKGEHNEDRRLVFVGDLCDRGPDSPGVIRLVKEMVEAGRAHMVLGNHELNLLRDDAKDGSGWYFPERTKRDEARYPTFERAEGTAREEIRAFFAGLPIGLERPDLRVIHAAWTADAVAKVRPVPLGGATDHFKLWHDESDKNLDASGLRSRALQQTEEFKTQLEAADDFRSFLDHAADYEVASQMSNPLKVLTSGVERKAEAGKQFYSSGKWRFVDRVRWWDEYQDEIPVVVGHYWRSRKPIDRNAIGKGGPDLFEGVRPHEWHGARKNVFCVDFSVGKRFTERKSPPRDKSDFHLAALRWPERTIRFDTGGEEPTIS